MKSILVYFLGATEEQIANTNRLVKMLLEIIGCDSYEIQTKIKYCTDYNTCAAIAKQELKDNFRPALKHNLVSIHRYKTIYLGFPTWWGTMPMAVFTFLEYHDFKNKTIYPFCTHEGSGLGRSELDLKYVCRHATIMPGLAVYGSHFDEYIGEIENWTKQ